FLSVLNGPVNAAFQSNAELAAGQLQAQKERLAAQEQAELSDKTAQILDIGSQQRVMNLKLQMQTLAIDSLMAVDLMKQEVSRLVKLYNEKADIERRMDEANTNLA